MLFKTKQHKKKNGLEPFKFSLSRPFRYSKIIPTSMEDRIPNLNLFKMGFPGSSISFPCQQALIVFDDSITALHVLDSSSLVEISN